MLPASYTAAFSGLVLRAGLEEVQFVIMGWHLDWYPAGCFFLFFIKLIIARFWSMSIETTKHLKSPILSILYLLQSVYEMSCFVHV